MEKLQNVLLRKHLRKGKTFIAIIFVQFELHFHKPEDISMYKEIQIDEIEQNETNKFIKLFPCVECK